MGSPHQPGERPEVSELLTAIPIDEKYVAFKSAYGKYLSVNQNGLLIGRSDAIGKKGNNWKKFSSFFIYLVTFYSSTFNIHKIEYFEIEFDYDYDGRKIYIKASNDKYVGVSNDGDIVALFDKKDEVSLTLRSLKQRENSSKKSVPDEEKSDDLRNVELNYVKKFQKFEDKRIKLSKDDVTELSKAKDDGRLHESLLDRREKMKADRYCK